MPDIRESVESKQARRLQTIDTAFAQLGRTTPDRFGQGDAIGMVDDGKSDKSALWSDLSLIGRTVIDAQKARGEELSTGQRIWEAVDALNQKGREADPRFANSHSEGYATLAQRGPDGNIKGELITRIHEEKPDVDIRFLEPVDGDEDRKAVTVTVSPFKEDPVLEKLPFPVGDPEPITDEAMLRDLLEGLGEFAQKAEPFGILWEERSEQRPKAKEILSDFHFGQALPPGHENVAGKLGALNSERKGLDEEREKLESRLREIDKRQSGINAEIDDVREQIVSNLVRMNHEDNASGAQRISESTPEPQE